MSVTTYKTSSFTNNIFLTYHEKLNNELENIPKLHKKFFMKSLAKHKFDLDIYIPQGNEMNRKIHPDKDYLLNKIVAHDNLVNKHKKKIDNISKDFSKFYRFYNYLKNSNTKQRDYMRDLINIYKDKNKKGEDIDYKNNENIFNNSVLLDTNNTNNFSKYENNNGKNILLNDKKILLKIDKAIHKTRSPNSIMNHLQKYEDNFITSINQSYFIKKNHEIESNELKKEMKTMKTESNISIDNKYNKMNKSYIDKKLNPNKSKKELKTKNKKIKNNTFDKYLINSKLLKINKISRNKLNNDLNKNKETLNTTHTIADNRNSEQNLNIHSPKFSKLRNLFLNKYNRNEFKNNTIKIIKTINNIEINSNKNEINKKQKLNYYSINNNSKYLLTSLNKINIKEKINDISEINKEKILLNTEKDNTNKKFINKSAVKTNIKANLPSINPKKEKLNKSINFIKIKESRIKSKLKNKSESKSNIKKENSNTINNYKKIKEGEINRLYSTISTNSNFLRDYPDNQIKSYFQKYKNIVIKKIETEKGSNLYPILDNIENIVKIKDIPKLTKSLYETKQYLNLRNNKKYNDIYAKDKSSTLLDRVIENEKKFPLIKYDCAEKIIFGEKDENMK